MLYFFICFIHRKCVYLRAENSVNRRCAFKPQEYFLTADFIFLNHRFEQMGQIKTDFSLLEFHVGALLKGISHRGHGFIR